MPHVYYLNPPPNPFWDFVTGLEDHPFFRGPPGRPQGRFAQPPSPPTGPQSQSQPAPPVMSEKAKGKQPSVEDEDPPEVDPATVNVKTRHEAREERRTARHEERDRFRGRGRFANAFDNNNDNDDANKSKSEEKKPDDEARACYRRDGRPCRMGRRDGLEGGPDRAWRGPPPFMHPFFARGPFGPGPDGPPGPPPHGPHHHPGPHGPPFMRGGRGGCGPGRNGHHGPHGHHHGPHPPPPHHEPRGSFDLSTFLNNLGERIGVDLTAAAASLGLDTRFAAPKSTTESDFEPRTDIFENKDQYTVHLSLPGAKKEDIAVDYDGEHSTIRITGIVHRPEVDEQMLAELIVDGRKRETGVFEKAIRLGTKKEPASIDVNAISARMADGILVVKVPKVEPVYAKKEVPITADDFELPHDGTEESDIYDDHETKDALFDADEQTLHEVPAPSAKLTEPTKEADLLEDEPVMLDISSKAKEKQAEEAQTKDNEKEQLPAYHAAPEAQKESEQVQHEHEHAREHEEDDWEKFSDEDGEGEYVKIAVN